MRIELRQSDAALVAAHAAVDAWADVGGGHLLIARLRATLPDDRAVAAILHIIDTTCSRCWDTDTSEGLCFCSRDD